MRTVRRLYLYAVAFVSLEVVLWGLIGLARSLFCPGELPCGVGSILARGLALILVGLPVLALHWWLAQRLARREAEEQSSGIRAVFLYGVLLSTLIPVVQNLIALVNRPALQLAGLRPDLAFLGGYQTWSDNLIAIGLNLLAAAYFWTVLQADWEQIAAPEAFGDIRRIQRTVWVLYGLGLTLIGMNLLLRFLFHVDGGFTSILLPLYWAVNGIVVTLLCTPLWVAAWLVMQRSLGETQERESSLRLGLLYLLAIAGAVTVLSSAGVILNFLLRFLFAGGGPPVDLLRRVADPLAVCIPFGMVWAYYGRQLGRSMAEVADGPRRAGMRRLYLYILSALGLGAAFVGLTLLFQFVIERLTDRLSGSLLLMDAFQLQLAAALATLFSALPVWLLTWFPLQAEALSAGDRGDHARRSILRKIYLYLALFTGVVGGMASAIALLNALLNAALAGETGNLLRNALNFTQLLILFAGLGGYHGLLLGRDNRMASAALAERHAGFPVLLLDPGDGSGAALQTALQKQLPRLPVSVQAVGAALPKAETVKAVILPAGVALEPSEALRKWLAKFAGARILVPPQRTDETARWFWAGQGRAPAAQAVQIVRQLAEGQSIRQQSGVPGWQIALYILLGLAGLPLLIALINLLASSTPVR